MEASFGDIFTHGAYQNMTDFHFSLTTLNDYNPQFLITLCIKIHDEHIALFD